MDRTLRSPVLGTWARRPLPAGDHDIRAKDPSGWRSHHTEFEFDHVRLLSADDLAEATRQRAFEIYMDRVRSGRPGTPDGDWFKAVRDVEGLYGGARH